MSIVVYKSRRVQIPSKYPTQVGRWFDFSEKVDRQARKSFPIPKQKLE